MRSTRSERRGCHRVSSEVLLANNAPVESMIKKFCGFVRCFQVTSKTFPGSSSPEISSARQSRVKPRHEAAHRQVLQVFVARRDRRFQAEQGERGKIRTQCKGCNARDRQSGRQSERDDVTRHSIRSLDSVERSQTARRRCLQSWLTKHITVFEKTSRRKKVRATPSTKVDGTVSDLRSSDDWKELLTRREPRRWNRDELACSACDESPKRPFHTGALQRQVLANTWAL